MTGPALSNRLTVLAAEVRGEVDAFKRSSTAAHAAYLSAGAMLVEAREHARRGQWAPFLSAAGIEARTARNMMALARAGLSADDLTRCGGVRGALESLREPAEKTETVSAIETPEPSGTLAPVHEALPVEGEPRSMRASAPARPVTAAGRKAVLRRERRSGGLCADCGAASGPAYRCPTCAAKRAEAGARAASRRRIGLALESRLREAAQSGAGLSLDAGEVARLARR